MTRSKKYGHGESWSFGLGRLAQELCGSSIGEDCGVGGGEHRDWRGQIVEDVVLEVYARVS